MMKIYLIDILYFNWSGAKNKKIIEQREDKNYEISAFFIANEDKYR